VRLDERRLAAVHPCFGQINVSPARWAPAWVPAALLLYDTSYDTAAEGREQAAATLSVLWRDAAQAVRHVIDATRLRHDLLARCGRLAWPAAACGAGSGGGA
jgi:hypothetical protein